MASQFVSSLVPCDLRIHHVLGQFLLISLAWVLYDNFIVELEESATQYFSSWSFTFFMATILCRVLEVVLTHRMIEIFRPLRR